MDGKFITSFFLIFFTSIFLVSSVSAENKAKDNIDAPKKEMILVKYQSVNPSDGSKFLIKRFQEKIKLFTLFISKTSKADYYQELVGIRLAELKYVIDNKDMARFENTTKRYYTTAGQLTEFIMKKNLVDRKEKARELFESHIPVLESLRDTFKDTTAEWRFVHDDINYLKIYTERLK